MFATGQQERLLRNCFANAFSHCGGRHYIGIGQNDREFLPTIAAQDVHATNLLAQPHCEFPQHIIAAIMAILVVHTLEMVKVDHND
ncbi:hypothetical protein D3C81_1962050 [compost metagenome]